MKYLFDMDDVWHLYIDVGNQWIYHRMERVGEEILNKNGEELPGPLGRLDALKQLEEAYAAMKEQTILLQREKEQLQVSMENTLEQQKREFEKNYNDLKKMTEEMQKEGRLWRQRYLDLAYQVSHKEK